MKDPDELSRGLLRKAQHDRYDGSFWPSESVAHVARSSALAVFEFVLDRLPDDIRKAAE